MLSREELEAQIAWLELKERLHLRLIASANDELSRRGKKIEELEKEKE